MGSGNEVLTFQFGHYSNFIGAHWWNLQEANFVYDHRIVPEINYDVMFREGENYKKETTFTPRLILTDLKGSLHTLSEVSTLYEHATFNPEEANWPTSNIEKKTEVPYEKNEFLLDVERSELEMDYSDNAALAFKKPKLYHLDDKVDVWTDFLSTKFHPRTIKLIQEYRHNDTNRLFDTYIEGWDVWKNEAFREDCVESCRAYIEECDFLQGFQVLYDCYNGYGGLTQSVLEYLKDEYPAKQCIVFPVIPPAYHSSSTSNTRRTCNIALSFASLVDYSSIYVPLCTGQDGWNVPGNQREFPNVMYKNVPYHTGALLASFLDTVTLPYRKRCGSSRMANIFSYLTPVSRILLSGTARVPFPIYADHSLMESFENYNGPLWTCVTPRCQPTADSSVIQNIVLRGLSQYTLFSNEQKRLRSDDPVYQCTDVKELFGLFLKFRSDYYADTILDSFKMPLNLCSSFPSIFDDNVLEDGYLSVEKRNVDNRVEHVPLFAGLHNCQSCKEMLTSLYEEAKKIKLQSFPQFISGGLEPLEYAEALEKIVTLSECYD